MVWPLLGAAFVVGLGVIGGLVLLVAPGLYLLAMWGFSMTRSLAASGPRQRLAGAWNGAGRFSGRSRRLSRSEPSRRGDLRRGDRPPRLQGSRPDARRADLGPDRLGPLLPLAGDPAPAPGGAARGRRPPPRACLDQFRSSPATASASRAPRAVSVYSVWGGRPGTRRRSTTPACSS